MISKAIGPGYSEEPENPLEILQEGSMGETAIIEPQENGDIIVDLSGDITPPEEDPLSAIPHDANLAEYLDDDQLNKIANAVVERYESDLDSCKDWFDMVADGISILGLKIEEKSEPWEGACSSKHPLLLESVVKYQAKARSQLLPPGGPVRTETLGLRTPEKLEKANRVREYMNYQVTEQITEYTREHDRMLFSQGFMGMAFTKMYFDKTLNRPVSKNIRVQDFIVNYHASDLASAEAYTHKIEMSKNELKRYQLVGFYRDVDLAQGTPATNDSVTEKQDDIDGRSPPQDEDNMPYMILEQHTLYDLPGFEDVDEEGIPTELGLPYIITVEKGSNKVLSIYRNWEELDPLKKKVLYFVDWPLVPGWGFYGYGYLHLIGALSRTATSSWQQLVDSGTWSNLQGGFVARGTRLSEPNDPIGPGVWKTVNASSDDIKKSIMALPTKEPSGTLLELMKLAVEWGKNLADNTEAVIAESTNYGPVGTTMALLDASGKLFSAIHERLFEAQKQELRILARLNRTILTDEYPYDVVGQNRKVFRDDFNEFVDVLPVTNPKVPSEAHRLARANAILEVALKKPELHNLREVFLEVHTAMGSDNPQRFLTPPPQEAFAGDPVTENSLVMLGIPIKAHLDHAHDPHIVVHTTMTQSPVYQANPLAMQSLTAHIMEHLSMKYRIEMEMMMGMRLPPPGAPMPPQIMEMIALKAAAASQKLLEKDKAQIAGQQGGQMDPTIMLAAEEVKLNREKLSLEAKKAAVEAKLKELKIRLEHEDRILDVKGEIKEAEIREEGRIKAAHIDANAYILTEQMRDDDPEPSKTSEKK